MYTGRERKIDTAAASYLPVVLFINKPRGSRTSESARSVFPLITRESFCLQRGGYSVCICVCAYGIEVTGD